MSSLRVPFTIDRDTALTIQTELTPTLRHIRCMLARDHKNVFGHPLQATPVLDHTSVLVRYAEPGDRCPDWPEAYAFRFADHVGFQTLHIVAKDELGLVYGMLHYSRHMLGVEPFWYWADLPPLRRESISWPAENFDSKRPCVRYRGWFVNDEVCLIGWKEAYPPTREVWEPVFEALLRCGGNMVIPGTDLPKSGIQAKLASEMGLRVTHHHAEPLGAEMFLRAYPGKTASYKEHPELFEALWREAIEKQKNDRIVWVLSFRGQGDQPFWANDPQFDTPERRGALISSVVRKQYDMVREAVTVPVCCMALYGEIAELYQAGHINVPDGVIKVWADNGYGKMVSRRHNNLNLRIPSLPAKGDKGKHGVYYHVTFHDLQASNHLTLFPAPSAMIASELQAAFDAGASEYALVNSGNIRPHLYTLDLVAELWDKGAVDTDEHLARYVRRMFGDRWREGDSEAAPKVALEAASGSAAVGETIGGLFRSYADCTIAYGPHSDDRAGDEFYHHPAREIVAHWLQGRTGHTNERLIWATGERPFPDQVRWFARKATEAIASWEALERRTLAATAQLPDDAGARLADQLLLSVRLHLSGCRGMAELGRAFDAYSEGSRHALAFVYASRALRFYAEGQLALREAEHGKWADFYRADWLTNIANTVGHMDTLRRYLRMHGDSPDMFLWYKAYLMPETEKHIYLENTHRNPLSDDALADALQERFRRNDSSLFD